MPLSKHRLWLWLIKDEHATHPVSVTCNHMQQADSSPNQKMHQHACEAITCGIWFHHKSAITNRMPKANYLMWITLEPAGLLCGHSLNCKRPTDSRQSHTFTQHLLLGCLFTVQIIKCEKCLVIYFTCTLLSIMQIYGAKC